MVRFIRKYPFLGLCLALSLEAWLALPGEAAIAIAASAMLRRGWSLLRVAAGGMAGMLINDLVLFSLSRAGRQALAHFSGAPIHSRAFHLTAAMMVGARFIPPLRSAAVVVFGIQGVGVREFLAVSLLSSAIWVLVYAVLGRRFQPAIGNLLHRLDGSRPGIALAAEILLTVGGVALLLHPALF